MTEAKDTVEIGVTCQMCKLRTSFPVSRGGYLAWKDGGLIQKVLSELSKEQRELMISGTCSHCFEKLFSGTEEE
jgi:hypothetical protein